MKRWRIRSGGRRCLAAFMALILSVSLIPLGLSPAAEAAAYSQPYLEKLVDWGVMQGDANGNLNGDKSITRAEFVAIVNRAFGFTQTGTTPFRDVPASSWYAEDVGIAYNVAYINGTSANTFSPNNSVTREQAAVILARIMMMQEEVGENIDFTDSRDMANWSRGLIGAAANYNLLTGYPDGSFRPNNAITRGDAAVLLVKAIGNPIQEAGDYSLGNTWGNVTITSSGVTLRDTVIGGNLYISEGVDLGHVTLENVTVLGEIVVSGGGVSEGGDDSIILRNVDASKLVVDNLSGQQVSLRVEGAGQIAEADVRTDAYLADRTSEGYGLAKIVLDGDADEKLALTLDGNIKEVVTTAPDSTLNLASGTAQTITVDEKATDSTLNIASGAMADMVNLDAGTSVTGTGDIDKLNVNASGSKVNMLPDEITIRPGITANIAGENMDSQAAAESSADPRLSAGYPRISDLAPTSATAQFGANKKGTVYWAVTAITDGSVAAEDLINPSTYAPTVVKRGSVSISGSTQTQSTNITGLTSDGSYYLSAVFVDAREQRSPLKVISFSTPDNTKPDFASGYPYLSKITSDAGWVTVMTTKTCRLYWAVLEKGAAAPTANDFKANAVTGNLGFGTKDMTKNTSDTFQVNTQPLEELESYDLYLWLTDVDGGQSSAVKKLSFTTVDGTPPVFNTKPTVNKVDKTSVGLYANLNENGTLYWVVVEHGTVYPKPIQGQGEVELNSPEAKLQVVSGMGALKSGKVTMTENKDASFTVSGLSAEKSYDLYYVAQDKAGNYTDTVGMIEIHTLDNNAPTVTQEFSKYNGTDTTHPLSNSDVTLVFSEPVQTTDTYTSLADLDAAVDAAVGTAGEDAARDKLATALSKAIYLYQVPTGGQPTKVEGYDPKKDGAKETADWTIDYRYAVVDNKNGTMRVTFPYGTGINLKSGATYYFEIQADTIADTSTAVNVMGQTKLDEFTTVFAVVNLNPLNENIIKEYTIGEETKKDQSIPVDLSWKLDPVTTDAVDSSIDWDMLIWSDTSVTFQLFAREVGKTTSTWELLGTKEIPVPDGTNGYIGLSLTRHFLQSGSNNPDFEPLKTLDPETSYEYAVSFTKVAGLSDRDTWSQRLYLKINVVAGGNENLSFLSADVNDDSWAEALSTGVTSIGQSSQSDALTLRKQFTDNVAPAFAGEYPKFDAGDSAVEMSLMLDRPGTVFYVVAPIDIISTIGSGKDGSGNINYGTEVNWATLPESGAADEEDDPPKLIQPDYLNIVNASSNYRNEKIKYGQVECASSVEVELVEGLDKQTKYIAYFVLQGTSQTYSQVLAYRFETTDVAKPRITLSNNSPSVSFREINNASADVTYALVASNEIPPTFANDLNDYIDPTKEDAWDTFTNHDGKEKYTILSALCASYANASSVFDEFANDEIRDIVEEFISGIDTMGAIVAAQGSKSLIQSNSYRQSQDFTSSMEGATIYYCLATAVSPLGSETAFAGVTGIRLKDSAPPEFLRATTSAVPGSKDGTWSGTVSFEFDEEVYQLVEQTGGIDQTPKEVWQTKYSVDKDSVARLLDIIGTNASLSSFEYVNEVRRSSSTLSLRFTDIPLGTSIILFDNSFICDENSNSTRERLSFILQEGNIGLVSGGVSFVLQS